MVVGNETPSEEKPKIRNAKCKFQTHLFESYI